MAGRPGRRVADVRGRKMRHGRAGSQPERVGLGARLPLPAPPTPWLAVPTQPHLDSEKTRWHLPFTESGMGSPPSAWGAKLWRLRGTRRMWTPPFRAVSPQTGVQNTRLSAKHLFPQGSSHSGETFCVFLKAMFRQCCSVASFRPDLVFKKRLALPSVPCGLLKTAICTDSEMPLHVGDKRDQP